MLTNSLHNLVSIFGERWIILMEKDLKIYYHYCSVETFYNIIKTSTIRFGNPLCMNDSAEIIWLLNMVREYLAANQQYKELVTHWELIENAAQFVLQEIDLPYIFCLSKEKDVLSQWRSYADDGRGIAIGFDVDLLLGSRDILNGDDIVYDRKAQMKLLNQIVNKDTLAKLRNIKMNDDRDIYYKSKILLSHILSKALVCKNPAFSEEKEYRLSCMPKEEENREVKVSKIMFRTKSDSFSPYIEINFSKIKNRVIKNIIIGPKSKMYNRNLWLFLRSENFMWVEPDKNWCLNDKSWKQHVLISNATYR